MQRIICCILAAIVLFSLTGCSGNGDIVGIWEQEMEMSILGEGIEEATSIASLCRFAFREDGSGIQEHIMQDGKYPNAVREFTWQLQEDMLTLDFGGGHTETFTLEWNRTSLKLENSRGTYELLKQ